MASTATRGLPSVLPFARAFLNPARTRSPIKLRFNSATAPRTVKTILPGRVAVSRDSDRLTNSMPRTRKVSSARASRDLPAWEPEKRAEVEAELQNYGERFEAAMQQWPAVSVASIPKPQTVEA